MPARVDRAVQVGGAEAGGGVIDEELSVARVVRMKREAEKTQLIVAGRGDLRCNVQEDGAGRRGEIGDHGYDAQLLANEQAVGLARRRGDDGGVGKCQAGKRRGRGEAGLRRAGWERKGDVRNARRRRRPEHGETCEHGQPEPVQGGKHGTTHTSAGWLVKAMYAS